MAQDEYVAGSPEQEGASSNSLLAHVPGGMQGEDDVPGCHLIAEQRRSTMLSAPNGNPNQAHSRSENCSRTTPKAPHIAPLRPLLLSLLLFLSGWLPKLPPQNRAREALQKKRKSRVLGTWEGTGEVNETENWGRLEGHLGEIKEESKGITAVDDLSSQTQQIFSSLVRLCWQHR